MVCPCILPSSAFKSTEGVPSSYLQGCLGLQEVCFPPATRLNSPWFYIKTCPISPFPLSWLAGCPPLFLHVCKRVYPTPLFLQTGGLSMTSVLCHYIFSNSIVCGVVAAEYCIIWLCHNSFNHHFHELFIECFGASTLQGINESSKALHLEQQAKEKRRSWQQPRSPEG